MTCLHHIGDIVAHVNCLRYYFDSVAMMMVGDLIRSVNNCLNFVHCVAAGGVQMLFRIIKA